MTYSIHQDWDPLKVCVVGRSYPPEFYSWITIPHVRKLFERIAIETEEDYQAVIQKLESFGVQIIRTNLPTNNIDHGGFYVRPPMAPRDHTVMIGEKFYQGYGNETFYTNSYDKIKDPPWPECNTWDQFEQLPEWMKKECRDLHGFWDDRHLKNSWIDDISDQVRTQGNQIIKSKEIHGAGIFRIGKDLYHGTESYDQDLQLTQQARDQEFPEYRNHIINTGGHSDGTYCPVCPGLIISLREIHSEAFAKLFPGWEVVYLPGQNWDMILPFKELKQKNSGKWWLPGFEHDQEVVDTVESWMGHWVGYVEETVFDLNMLIIDPKNVIVFNYNKKVFDALERHGITPHVITDRHRYFWDGGVHCITSDLHREGTLRDYFPERSQ